MDVGRWRTGDPPFLLFDNARDGNGGRLFQAPLSTTAAWGAEDVLPALEQVRAALKRGLFAAGWLQYEAGLALEPRLARRVKARGTLPLLWFGLFDSVQELDSAEILRLLPDPSGAWLSAPRPRISRAQYQNAFGRVRRYIEAGDVYQVNLSYRADLTLLGHPMAAYAQLRGNGAGAWSAAVCDGANWLLSTSPELFFRVAGGVIEAKPMKGTAPRDPDPERDSAVAQRLAQDPKERAENLMIVDLLRNDLSRIAERGSVRAPELFHVETYPTLHTMTSSVRAHLAAGRDAVDALRALFPCGSVTGAPKIRAMEIIGELETDERGVYTGAIGWLGPHGEAEFNVAIRTLALVNGAAEVGLGSGVVYDSDANAEWRECKTKGAFVTAGAPKFCLIETMYCSGDGAVRLLELHLARLKRSALAFGFAFEDEQVAEAITTAAASVDAPCVLRLTLDADGAAHIERRALPPRRPDAARVQAAALPVAPDDFRLRHKTTLRSFYDDARGPAPADEVVFVDPEGFVTEGSIANVFLERDGVLLTPPASRGLLPGVLRASLLSEGRAREQDLRLADLKEGFLLGNAVRGLFAARFGD